MTPRGASGELKQFGTDMKQAFPLLAAVALTAFVTYLAVSNRQYRLDAHRLAEDLSRAEERVSNVEEELRQTQAQLQAARDSHVPPRRPTAAGPSRLEVPIVTTSSESGSVEQSPEVEPPPSLLPPPPPPPPPPPIVAVPLAVPVPVEGPTMGWVRYRPVAGASKCVVEGTSSIHDWRLESLVLGGELAVDSRYDLLDLAAGGRVEATNIPVRGEFVCPVRSLKSYNRRLDDAVLQALNEPRHRRIEFHPGRLSVRGSTNGASAALCDTAGELVINGVTNVVEMPVALERTRAGLLRVSGSKALRLTAFKVRPPDSQNGNQVLRTGDVIKVSFTSVLARDSTGD